jgi:hypothetical protein
MYTEYLLGLSSNLMYLNGFFVSYSGVTRRCGMRVWKDTAVA